MLIGCDPGTRSLGLAFGEPDCEAPKSLALRLPGADDMVLTRTLGLAAESLSEYCKLVRATHVVIEAPLIFAKQGDSNIHVISALIQMSGVLRAAAWRAGCQVLLAPSQKVRAFFVGQARPENPKSAVIAKCESLGWKPHNHDCADALATWAYGCSYYYPGWALNTSPLFSQRNAA